MEPLAYHSIPKRSTPDGPEKYGRCPDSGTLCLTGPPRYRLTVFAYFSELDSSLQVFPPLYFAHFSQPSVLLLIQPALTFLTSSSV